jgi:uncharacterized protein DUF4242
MSRYLIERNFGEELRVDKEAIDAIQAINEEEGVEWLYSFVTADQKKSYCLFEAPDAESIAEAARRNNLPADVIVEVGRMSPEAFV